MTRPAEHVEEILRAPVGVAVLAAAASLGAGRPMWRATESSSTQTIERAAAMVRELPWDDLLGLVLDAAHSLAGPWMPNAASDVALAYSLAAERRPIADALAERIEPSRQSGRLDPQQLWLDDGAVDINREPPKFADLTHVYGNGEFTFGGVWTVTQPPEAIAEQLAAHWEMYPGPISRWRLPIRDNARIFRIDRPGDWAELVTRYPRAARRPHSGWELPGPNQHTGHIAELLAVPGQNAARSKLGRHVLPDWTAVSADFDGVHLTWAGFITSEGRVVDLPDGDVTMLRYWASERTLWLADVFAEPEPLDLPLLLGDSNDAMGVGEPADVARLERDRRKIACMFRGQGLCT